MATILRHPSIAAAPSRPSYVAPAMIRLSFSPRSVIPPQRVFISSFWSTRASNSPVAKRVVPLGASIDAESVETAEDLEGIPVEVLDMGRIQQEDIVDGAVATEDKASDEEISDADEEPASAVLASLQIYKEAFASEDKSKIAEIEAFLKSIEDEKNALELKVTALSAELSIEKDRVLRISADFDNFRKRTERERLSLVTNAQGEVVENFLSMLDNFERAKTQIKVETEGEEKINNSYQNIYKQFMEILSSVGVVPVETVGNPFDPLLHEAIMQEESAEFEEGIILEEYRKGFKLGDRLLRPSMVKVSAGPGPAKTDPDDPAQDSDREENRTTEKESI